MDVKNNIDLWNSVEHWETGSRGNGVPLHEGEKWSASWGNSRFQWYATLLPRIHGFIPSSTILEIACGRGRWSQYLKNECDRLVLVDISANCIDFCRQRFAGESHVDYLVGTGSDLAVDDESIDFVFSFDSLVHADLSVIEGYLREIDRVLSPGGGAFLHHSNLADCDIGKIKDAHLRDPSVSARHVVNFLSSTRLSCTVCELLPWDISNAEVGQCIDAFLSVSKGSTFGEPKIVRNLEAIEMEKKVARFLYAAYDCHGSRTAQIPNNYFSR